VVGGPVPLDSPQPPVGDELLEVLLGRLVVDLGLFGDPRGVAGFGEHLRHRPNPVFAVHVVAPRRGRVRGHRAWLVEHSRRGVRIGVDCHRTYSRTR
jgi:hypothetical protein